ncbi:ATP-dependent RNA helicase DDX19/DBP5 [Nematocida minor]|uniref:ATP-dependent RNA helicase DDX19/DBP5 n=1 Tax=Nematocida minor TaxID=1912983 RepID=UPI00221E4967|nr:ATP-dependent RNA helicase DDX19/DBP5 [Nematocida minor]KAI5191113.1 ATP-dependent RNA helicase DDX19/DBP5 [Nematocida minor]
MHNKKEDDNLDLVPEDSNRSRGMDLPDDVRFALEMINQMEVSKKENSSAEEYKNSLLSSELLSKNSFEDLSIPENIIKALRSLDFKNPSAIQQKSIPEIAKGDDVAFQSHSGSGKTIAFLVGALSVLDIETKCPQIIIITPTRDLSKQISAVLEKFKETIDFTSLQALPDIIEERAEPEITEQIIVGSPGTIKKILRDFKNINNVKMVILDEADALLEEDMGAQTVSVVNKIRNKQLVLFSATFSSRMKEAIAVLSKKVKTWYLEESSIKPANITQFYMEVSENKKQETLRKLYELISVGQSIIFVHSRDKAADVQRDLKKDGFDSELLHGQLTKSDRDEVISRFKKGEIKVLVTTNVLSRGLDVPQLNLAVNYDMPKKITGGPDIETYVHRIGRTGRFNRAGVSITFITGEKDRSDLLAIQRAVGSQIKYITLEALTKAITEKQKLEDSDDE